MKTVLFLRVLVMTPITTYLAISIDAEQPDRGSNYVLYKNGVRNKPKLRAPRSNEYRLLKDRRFHKQRERINSKIARDDDKRRIHRPYMNRANDGTATVISKYDSHGASVTFDLNLNADSPIQSVEAVNPPLRCDEWDITYIVQDKKYSSKSGKSKSRKGGKAGKGTELIPVKKCKINSTTASMAYATSSPFTVTGSVSNFKQYLSHIPMYVQPFTQTPLTSIPMMTIITTEPTKNANPPVVSTSPLSTGIFPSMQITLNPSFVATALPTSPMNESSLPDVQSTIPPTVSSSSLSSSSPPISLYEPTLVPIPTSTQVPTVSTLVLPMSSHTPSAPPNPILTSIPISQIEPSTQPSSIHTSSPTSVILPITSPNSIATSSPMTAILPTSLQNPVPTSSPMSITLPTTLPIPVSTSLPTLNFQSTIYPIVPSMQPSNVIITPPMFRTTAPITGGNGQPPYSNITSLNMGPPSLTPSTGGTLSSSISSLPTRMDATMTPSFRSSTPTLEATSSSPTISFLPTVNVFPSTHPSSTPTLHGTSSNVPISMSSIPSMPFISTSFNPSMSSSATVSLQSNDPSSSPSISPLSLSPSSAPSIRPSNISSNLPSLGQSDIPSTNPSDHPTSSPTYFPSYLPTKAPIA